MLKTASMQKRTPYQIVEQLKDIMHINHDKHIAEDMGITYNVLRLGVHRNSLSKSMYEAILGYCFVKRIDVLSVFYKTVRKES